MDDYGASLQAIMSLCEVVGGGTIPKLKQMYLHWKPQTTRDWSSFQTSFKLLTLRSICSKSNIELRVVDLPALPPAITAPYWVPNGILPEDSDGSST
jgi:hypothetical protein